MVLGDCAEATLSDDMIVTARVTIFELRETTFILVGERGRCRVLGGKMLRVLYAFFCRALFRFPAGPYVTVNVIGRVNPQCSVRQSLAKLYLVVV